MPYDPAGYGENPYGPSASGDPGTGRDYDLWADARDRLEATGAFDLVVIGRPDERARSAVEAAACWVVPLDDDELDIDPDLVLVGCRFSLVVEVRAEDVEARADALDRLKNVAKNALNGQSLAGISLPGRTRVRRASHGPRKHPTAPLELTVEAPYFDPYAGLSDTDD
jgi:hypothetical protein